MEYRSLGQTGMSVSAVSFGAWAIGGTWGPVDDEESMRALRAAVDAGVNFIDTADVYGDGRSDPDARGLQPREPDCVGGPQPFQPGHGDGGSSPAALPPPARL
jgi:hypothetical protein